MNNKMLKLHEDFKNNCLEEHESDCLQVLAHLYKETDASTNEFNEVCWSKDVMKKLLLYHLELEYQSLHNNGGWKRPKVIDENEDSWKYEDGLWYEKDVYIGGVCPLCGKGSIIHWIDKIGYGVCYECELAWDSGHPVPKQWPDYEESTEEEDKAAIESQNKILSFQRAEDIYAKSDIFNEVMLDLKIRRAIESIKQKRHRPPAVTNGNDIL